tara:strand:+ start:773 stop:955 length:183 start_codon:yes stop_codon:yes gene_type:complete
VATLASFPEAPARLARTAAADSGMAFFQAARLFHSAAKRFPRSPVAAARPYLQTVLTAAD